MRSYFFPPLPRGGYPNPYCTHFKEALAEYTDLLNAGEKPTRMAAWELLKFSTRADLYVFNWLEIIGYHRAGLIQFLMAFIAVWTVIARRARILWVLHNIEPHEGHNWQTRYFYRLLFKHAALTVAHSREAEAFARKKAKGQVVYCCHPIISYPVKAQPVQPTDILIWGSILPYKGVAEFLEMQEVQASGLDIHVIGVCKDLQLARRIDSLTNEHVRFENRKATFDEIASLCRQAKFVLFPYVGGSVSSSGALIDTIAFGGTPVGPHRGAFKDLSEEGVCLTYQNTSAMMDILKSEKVINTSVVRSFLQDNTWDAFARKITSLI